jgi:uncharacterized protein
MGTVSKQNKPVTPKHELRVVKNVQRLEIRKNAAGQRTVSGYFATFNTLSSDLGGFVERISPGAYTQSLRDNPEVLCLYNHNTDLILGRVSSGTLSVSEDSIGLRFKVTLPDTSYANDLVNLMERGDVAACSFAFSINGDNGDTWEMIGDKLVRTLVSVNLYEGSIVGNPAYPNTVADLRSCPVTLRSKLTRSSDPDCDPDSEDYDADACSDLDDLDDIDSDDSEDYRCNYRCAACRNASHVHLTNLSEDDADARSHHSKKKVSRALSADDMFEEQRKCSYRCAACRSLLSGHWPVPNAVNEDDEDARAAAHILSLRRR